MSAPWGCFTFTVTDFTSVSVLFSSPCSEIIKDIKNCGKKWSCDHLPLFCFLLISKQKLLGNTHMKLLLMVTAVLLLNSDGSGFVVLLVAVLGPSSCFIWAIASPHMPALSSLPLFVFPPVWLPPRLDCLQLCSVPSCVSLCNQSRVVSSFPLWRDVFAPCACLCIPLSSIFLWVSVSCSLNKCINYSKLAFSLDPDCFILMDLFENLITVQTLLQGWNCFVTRDAFSAAYSVFDSVRGIWMNGSQKTNSLLFLVLDGKH